MNEDMSCVELLRKIDFGDIDGLYDPNINDYFIDNDYRESLLTENKYFVIGRKGTGKSALYNWLNINQVSNHNMVSNKSFNDFPFEKLLSLSDDDFAKPNQYQSVWKNIILSEIASLLVTDQSNPIDDDLSELDNFVSHVFGNSLTELHKEVTRKMTKTTTGLTYGLTASSESGKEIDLCDGYRNITKINTRLLDVISSYTKRYDIKQYIVQFDQLDDNYTAFIKNTDYLQCIISLFKTIYQINQHFRSICVPIKVIAYLRSDIYNKFNKFDPESARWDQYVLKLNWSIINRNDWYDAQLLKLLNARIKHSTAIDTPSPFHTIFNKYKIRFREPIFKYIIHRTFQRPRDVIQFCIKIQDESKSTHKLNAETIKNAEKEFSLWLLGELENEIAPSIPDTESLYELLRLFGRQPYNLSIFKSKYANFSKRLKMDAEELLRLLYSFGIISNVVLDGRKITEQFSIIRNDRSVFNRDVNVITHSGFYEGLHTSKFMKR